MPDGSRPKRHFIEGSEGLEQVLLREPVGDLARWTMIIIETGECASRITR